MIQLCECLNELIDDALREVDAWEVRRSEVRLKPSSNTHPDGLLQHGNFSKKLLGLSILELKVGVGTNLPADETESVHHELVETGEGLVSNGAVGGLRSLCRWGAAVDVGGGGGVKDGVGAPGAAHGAEDGNGLLLGLRVRVVAGKVLDGLDDLVKYGLVG